MPKICPYLAAAWILHPEEDMLYCVKEHCEMWSTIMKSCCLRNFFDDRKGSPSAKEVTKEQLEDMLDEEGGLGSIK